MFAVFLRSIPDRTMKTTMNTQDRFVIIMAGGRGERFWPVSREKMRF